MPDFSPRIRKLLLKLAKDELSKCEDHVRGEQAGLRHYEQGYSYSKEKNGSKYARKIWYSDVLRSRRELKKAEAERREARALVRELERK